jgi:hypothetical protein
VDEGQVRSNRSRPDGIVTRRAQIKRGGDCSQPLLLLGWFDQAVGLAGSVGWLVPAFLASSIGQAVAEMAVNANAAAIAIAMYLIMKISFARMTTQIL